MLHLFHLLCHLLNFLVVDARATKEGTEVKEIDCERCGFKYAYRLRRAAEGQAISLFFKDNEAAEAAARDNLRRALTEGCDAVPCPGCGWYQPGMVRSLRRLRCRRMLLTGLTLLPLSVVLAAVGILVLPLGPDASIPRSIIGSFLLGLAGLLFALGIGLAAISWPSGRFYNPNAVDEGQVRSYSKVDYESQKTIPPAD